MRAETAWCLKPATFSTARLMTKPTIPVRMPMAKQKAHLSTTYRTWSPLDLVLQFWSNSSFSIILYVIQSSSQSHTKGSIDQSIDRTDIAD
jgi:hypothetical protein